MLAELDPLGELDLLRRGQERHLADVLEEELEGVGRDLGLRRPRALALVVRRRVGPDDLDLLLVQRRVERVDLRRVEVELVQRERELVGVERAAGAPVLEQRACLVRLESGLASRASGVGCCAQDRPPFRRWLETVPARSHPSTP
jgi:hypothetical protein